jgi:cell division septal protein FtsQ
VGKEWYVYLVNFGDMKKNERFKEVQAELQRTMTKHVELIEGGKSPGGAVAEVQQTIEQQRQRDRIFSVRTLIIVIVVILLVILIIALISIISKIKVNGALEYYNYKLLDPYVNVINLGRYGRKEIFIGRTKSDVNLRDFEGAKPFAIKAARVKGKVVNRLLLPEGLSVEFVNREAGEYLNDGDIFKVANYSFKFMAPQG